MLPAERNPYRTALTDALAPRLDEPLAAVVERFQAMGQRALVVGPHGSGKTTLLEALAPLLSERLGEVTWLRLRAEPAHNRTAVRALPPRITGILLLDGLEQLGPWAWWRLAQRAPRILATSHHVQRLPVLRRHRTDGELLSTLVRELGQQPPSDAAELVHRHRGNLRDCLRELYDRAAASGEIAGEQAETLPKRRSRD